MGGWGSTENLDRGYGMNSMALESMLPTGQRTSMSSPLIYGADLFGGDSL